MKRLDEIESPTRTLARFEQNPALFQVSFVVAALRGGGISSESPFAYRLGARSTEGEGDEGDDKGGINADIDFLVNLEGTDGRSSPRKRDQKGRRMKG
jgi:hypothetical protein